MGEIESSLRRTTQVWIPRLVILAFIIVFFVHFGVIWIYAVNIPYADEWTMVFRNPPPAPFTLRWMVTPHNEHQILTTHAFITFQYYLNGWNNKTNIILNFLIYGGTVAALIALVKKLAPAIQVWIIFAFAFFLLSPILWMNHFIGLQVCFHFWLLFFLLSVGFLFSSSQRWLSMVLGAVAAILSLFSLGTGLASGLVLIFVFSLFKIGRARAAARTEVKRELLQVAFVIATFICALAMWHVSFAGHRARPPLALPNHLTFWRSFLNLISFGFGIDRISSALGAVCLSIVIVPIALQICRERKWPSRNQWALFASVGGILGALASVALGRANLGLEWSKVSRYAEIGMPLILFSLISWHSVVANRRIRAAALVILLGFCLIAFSNNWNLEPYRQLSELETNGSLCIKARYQYEVDRTCPSLLPEGQQDYLNRARLLNVSFFREIVSGIQLEKARPLRAPEGHPSASVGALDVADCIRIGGWASAVPANSDSLNVDVYDGEKLLTTVKAQLFRGDVYHIGRSPFSGFDFPTPAALKDGQSHLIRVKIGGTNQDLVNSPKLVVCRG